MKSSFACLGKVLFSIERHAKLLTVRSCSFEKSLTVNSFACLGYGY
ncbi:MAG: hypothetical protein FWC60_11205 [Firmicutes bacterium]|nr:hypothetical protein [Bacillota bacterium]